MKNVFIIAGREFRSLIASPSGLFALAVFALVTGGFYNAMLGAFADASLKYYETAALPVDFSFNSQVMTTFLSGISLLVIILVPTFTMRSLAEERKLNTLELMLTLPVGERTIVTGKFLGAYAFFGVFLAVILAQVLAAAPFATIDYAWAAVAFLGFALLGAFVTAAGIFVSATTSSQILAYIFTFLLVIVFWILGGAAAIPSLGFLRMLAALSLQSRVSIYYAGTFDSRTIVLVVSFVIFFLAAASHHLRRSRG